MKLSQDAQAPQCWIADLGGISISADTLSRKLSVFVSPADCTEPDYANALALLSGLGVAGFHDARLDDGIYVLTAHF